MDPSVWFQCYPCGCFPCFVRFRRLSFCLVDTYAMDLFLFFGGGGGGGGEDVCLRVHVVWGRGERKGLCVRMNACTRASAHTH